MKDRLASEFGQDEVFWDVDAAATGDDLVHCSYVGNF